MERVLFSIEGVSPQAWIENINRYEENEVLLLPQTTFEVIGNAAPLAFNEKGLPLLGNEWKDVLGLDTKQAAWKKKMGEPAVVMVIRLRIVAIGHTFETEYFEDKLAKVQQQGRRVAIDRRREQRHALRRAKDEEHQRAEKVALDLLSKRRSGFRVDTHRKILGAFSKAYDRIKGAG